MKTTTMCIMLLISMLSLFNPKPTLAQTIKGYTIYHLHDFTVYVSDKALHDYASTTQEAIQLLETKLQEINALGLKKSILTDLQKIPFFMEWASNNGAAQFHPSREWLVANGYIPEKAQSVEISNITNFINWTKLNQPYMVLHELAHGYHFKVLGEQHKGILDAYQNAMSKGLYNNVLYNPGNNNSKQKLKAYATENHKEYFSEMTEAYWGENDFFPFNRKDLQTHDPQAYQLLSTIWQLETAPTTVASKASYDPSLLTVHNHLNTTVDVYWIDFEGVEKKWGTLAADQQQAFQSYIGHSWRIRDSNTNAIRKDAILKTVTENISIH